MKIFSLFYVSDCKGGELNYNINMSEYNLCKYLYEDSLLDFLDDIKLDNKLKESYTIEEILEIYDECYDSDWDNPYAYDCTGGFRCYQHIDNKLVEVDMVEVISNSIKEQVFNEILKDILTYD